MEFTIILSSIDIRPDTIEDLVRTFVKDNGPIDGVDKTDRLGSYIGDETGLTVTAWFFSDKNTVVIEATEPVQKTKTHFTI